MHLKAIKLNSLEISYFLYSIISSLLFSGLFIIIQISGCMDVMDWELESVVYHDQILMMMSMIMMMSMMIKKEKFIIKILKKIIKMIIILLLMMIKTHFMNSEFVDEEVKVIFSVLIYLISIS